MAGTRLAFARKQIEFARQYTYSLLNDLDDAEWFRQPSDGVTHIAWQVGHLAMAQYGLCLFRQRGRQPGDTDLMSGKFRKQFSKSTAPDPDPANNPTPAELKAILDRVHHQSLKEMEQFSDEELDSPIDEPYAVHATRLGALLFCSHHEMLHAGQIGLIRRLLGRPTTR